MIMSAHTGQVHAQVYKCAHCSAPLQVPPPPPGLVGPARVVCAYCKTENHVGAQAFPPPPPPPMPPPPMPQVAIVMGGPSVRVSGSPVGAVVGLAMFLVISGVVTGAILWTRHRVNEAVSAPSWPVPVSPAVGPAGVGLGADKPRVWSVWGLELCMVDANGDGAPDPVASAAFAGGGSRLAAFDARTGEVVWTLPEGDPKDPPKLWCSGGVMVLERKGFAVERLDPRTGAASWKATLPDKVDEIAAGEGCVQIGAANRTTTSLSLKDGSPAPSCKPIGASKSRLSSWRKATVQAGDLTVAVTPKGPGTERYELTATRGAKREWQKTLELSPVPGRTPFDGGEQGVFLAGHKPGDRSVVVYAFVTTAGEVRFQKELAGEDGADVVAMGKGTAFVLKNAGALRAVDVTNGSVRWTVP